MTSMIKRYAIIHTPAEHTVASYLPANYEVLGCVEHDGKLVTVIGGRDNCGWTLDAYVLPRLASGLYFGEEIGLDHPVMKLIPEHKTKVCPNCDRGTVTDSNRRRWRCGTCNGTAAVAA